MQLNDVRVPLTRDVDGNDEAVLASRPKLLGDPQLGLSWHVLIPSLDIQPGKLERRGDVVL